MIKAIIFDCFGVLATEAWLPLKAKYFGKNPELFEKASFLVHQANKGLISHRNFIDKVSDLAGVPAEQISKEITQNVPNEELFDYISELKPKYKIGFLSNVASDRLKRIFSPEQLAMFDNINLSYEMGYIKPEAKAFEMMADSLGVGLSDCVLVDDQMQNVKGAQDAGMQAILFEDTNQLKRALRQLESKQSEK